MSRPILLFHRPVRPGRGDRCLVLDLDHNAKRTVALLLRFHTNRRADPFNDPKAGHLVVLLYPHLRVRLSLDLTALEEARAHLPRRTGAGIAVNGGPVVRIADLVSITGLADHPPRGFRLRLRDFRFGEEPEPGAVLSPRRPIVDPLGQLMTRAWPGKAKRIGPMGRAPDPPAAPTIMSRPPRVSPRVRIDRDRGRWWIITPAGDRMFSIGMNCVTTRAGGPVTGMARLHRWLPPRRGPLAVAWSAGRTGGEASFYTANLVRRYGPDWRSRWATLATDRLLGWGFNTIGNWSDPLAFAERRMFYTVNAAWWDEPPGPGVDGLYGGFPDVFSPAFARRCDEAARRGTRPDDPLLLGYFVHNEPRWQRADLHLAELALRSNRAPYTRRFLLGWLRRKYRTASARPTPADLDRMRELLVDRYMETACGALRRHDPNHLLLGLRFYGVPPRFVLGAMRHMDVVTVNTYAPAPDPAIMETLHRTTGKPVMLGEFHMGAVDRGMTSFGLVGVRNQHERGVAYAHYMERAASIPYCVGAHWFQHVDQPVLGRFDGENYNIGFVDVTDRPYRELAAAARAVNPRLGQIHAGLTRPRTRAPRLEPTGLIW